jgi:hypothetical protein
MATRVSYLMFRHFTSSNPAEQSGSFGFGIDYRNNIDQVVLLRSPAWVLYSTGSPIGRLNLPEKRPQSNSAYELSVTYTIGETTGRYK